MPTPPSGIRPEITMKRHYTADGKLVVKHYMLGKEVPRIELIGNKASVYSGCWLIENDLKRSLNWAQQAESLAIQRASSRKEGDVSNNIMDDFAKALFIASSVFYAKAFNTSRGRAIRLRRDQLDPEFHKAHDGLMTIRNNLTAHSGELQIEKAWCYFLMPMWTDGDYRVTGLDIRVDNEQPNFFSGPIAGPSFSQLIAHAIEKTTKLRTELGDVITKKACELGMPFWIIKSEGTEPVDVDNPSGDSPSSEFDSAQ